ncbi:MAG: hypothetical protein ACOY16_09540 [Chloroflexota bacterium]
MFVFSIPISDPKNPPAVKFPPRCVHCGLSPAEFLPLKIPMGVEKRSQPVMLELNVPLCAEGAKRERGIVKVTLIPFMLGGLLIGLAAFVFAWLLTPEPPMQTVQTRSFDLVIGAFVGLIAGIIGGSLVELAFKLLFASLYGKLLLKRPLTALEILSDTENVLGFSAALSKDKKQLKLTFEHEEIGKEFQRLNL